MHIDTEIKKEQKRGKRIWGSTDKAKNQKGWTDIIKRLSEYAESTSTEEFKKKMIQIAAVAKNAIEWQLEKE